MILNSLMALPFYTNREEQHHRLPYVYGNIYPLLCGQDALLPFQIVTESDISNFRARLMDKDDNEVVSNFDQYIGNAMEFVESDGKYIALYKGAGLDEVIPAGTFYIEITLSNGATYYSELFTTVCSTDGLIKIEWRDFAPFASDDHYIYYDNDYTNRIYVKSDLGKPEYTFEEEGEERDGFFFPEKQLSTKTYRFSFLAPEYLCDALRMLRMSEDVFITDQYGNRYSADSILVTPEWLDSGDLANVSVEFTSNSVVKKLGIGYLRS